MTAANLLSLMDDDNYYLVVVVGMLQSWNVVKLLKRRLLIFKFSNRQIFKPTITSMPR